MSALLCVTCHRARPLLGGMRCAECTQRREMEALRRWEATRHAAPYGWPVYDRRRQRGQALVETAFALPVLLALLVGTADVAQYGLRVLVAQNTASTIAGLLAQDVHGAPVDEAMARGCYHGQRIPTTAERVVTVVLRCDAPSLTSVLPARIEVTASAVMPAPAPTYPPAPTWPPTPEPSL